MAEYLLPNHGTNGKLMALTKIKTGNFTLIDDIASSFSCLVEVVKDLMAKVETLENA